MNISELSLESLQAVWGEFVGQRDPRQLGELVEALERGKLDGLSPFVHSIAPVYRELIKRYDCVYNRWKSR